MGGKWEGERERKAGVEKVREREWRESEGR